MGPNPPQRKASVILPPEILDKILEYIPARSKGGGRSTLIACALVATWWTGPSQRHLFSLVTIDDKNHQRWINGVALSETKAHLLQYTRSFLHCLTPDDGTWYQMINLPRDSGGYLSAFHNLRMLSLNRINFEHAGERAFHACFSAFRETLTDLFLGLIITSFNTFVTLVKYFPNITSLQLGSTSLRPDNGPVPPLSRPLRGMISILCPKPSFQEFVNKLAKLDMQYERLVIESSIRASGDVLKSILQLSASTIKYLRLVVPAQDLVAADASHFPQLRELELSPSWFGSACERLLSSITSTKFRKLVFSAGPTYDLNIFWKGSSVWASIDKQLCELAARLAGKGRCQTLEVELRFSRGEIDLREHTLARFLPEFRSRVKGVVNFTYISSDQD